MRGRDGSGRCGPGGLWAGGLAERPRGFGTPLRAGAVGHTISAAQNQRTAGRRRSAGAGMGAGSGGLGPAPRLPGGPGRLAHCRATTASAPRLGVAQTQGPRPRSENYFPTRQGLSHEGCTTFASPARFGSRCARARSTGIVCGGALPGGVVGLRGITDELEWTDELESGHEMMRSFVCACAQCQCATRLA